MIFVVKDLMENAAVALKCRYGNKIVLCSRLYCPFVVCYYEFTAFSAD